MADDDDFPRGRGAEPSALEYRRLAAQAAHDVSGEVRQLRAFVCPSLARGRWACSLSVSPTHGLNPLFSVRTPQRGVQLSTARSSACS